MNNNFRRVWAMPHKDTFKVKPIRELLDKVLPAGGVIVDPFARNTNLGTITNDLSPETSAQHHMKAEQFGEMLVKQGVVADAIIFDPPYSLEQCKRSYNSVGVAFTQRDGQIVNRWTAEKDNLTKILRPGGIVISFGWNSTGFGKSRGFEIVEMLVVCHGAGHNDTICTVERKAEGGHDGV